MRSIHIFGLAVILLITACGQPADLSSSTPAAEAPSATSESASPAPQTTVANVQPVPCPTFAVYPPPAPGETPTPTNTPPPPTPTVDPETVPTGTAPGGLGTITLPNDDATVRGIFTALPKTIGDYQLFDTRTEDPYYFIAMYRLPDADPVDMRGRLMLGARSDIDQGPRFPGRIVASYPEYWRRDGQVFYGYDDRQSLEPLNDQYKNCREERSVNFTFVAPESSWLFHAEAPAREELELVIAAFAQAVKASPAPIPYVAPTPYPTLDATLAPPGAYPNPGFPNSMYPSPQDANVYGTPTATPTTTPIP